MPYGSPLGVDSPVVTVTTGPQYATDVNAVLEALRVVVEQKVTPGGIDMDADLSFLSGGVPHSATDLLTTSFEVQAAPLSAVTFPGAIYLAGVNGDAYLNDVAGNQIRLTNAGAVNVSTTGGITGTGYGSGGVEINWSSGNVAYRFFSGASTYADVVCDDLRLNDGDTNFISIVSPALAGDYTITLPSAVPATSNTVLTMSTAGVVAASATPTVTSLAATGAITAGTTIIATGAMTAGGLITASGGVTAAVDQHVTVSGTGRFKHGNTIVPLQAAAGYGDLADWNVDSPNNRVVSTTAAPSWYVPLSLPVGASVSRIDFFLDPAGSGSKTFQLSSRNGTTTALVVEETVDNGGSGTGSFTLTVSPEVVITSGLSYHARFIGADSGDAFYHIEVHYNQP